MNTTVSAGLLIFRVSLAGMMLFAHGLPKVMKFKDRFHSFADPLGIGSEASFILTVFAEFLCSALIILGLKARWAAIPLFITMIVAAFMVHLNDPFGKKELALLYASGFLLLIFTGGGRFGLDALFGKSKGT
jgi:putative oxidoreductase